MSTRQKGARNCTEFLPTVRVGNAVFHGHFTPNWGDGVGDVFVLHALPGSGLPPWLWGKGVTAAGKVLFQKRPTACIWLRVPPVEETGRWWREMLIRSLGATPVPVAVGSGDAPPAPERFSFPVRRVRSSLPAGKLNDKYPDLPPAATAVLGVMARIGEGYTAEIASLALASLPTARKALRKLANAGLVMQKTQSRWPYWEITRKGVSLALRMWGVPKGARFQVRTERKTRTAYRHRRVSRLWNAWLQKAGYTVLGGWSEVLLPGARGFAPDALAWGRVGEYETLFWLEVEGGHKSRRQIAAKAEKRLLVAQGFARMYNMHLVFALLGIPWAVEAAQRGMTRIEPFTAVLLGDWNAFGRLPKVVWGRIQK